MDDLVTWLRAQLDDDERVARQMMAEPGGFYIEAETSDVNVMTVGAHVYRWTPKRVLAEVEAKRRIIDEYEQARAYYAGHPEAAAGEVTGLRFAVKCTALSHAERPGYREEWRP